LLTLCCRPPAATADPVLLLLLTL